MDYKIGDFRRNYNNEGPGVAIKKDIYATMERHPTIAKIFSRHGAKGSLDEGLGTDEADVDYKPMLKKRMADYRGIDSDHIDSTPRADLQKVYVFTKDISTKQLRRDLEKLVGINPRISTAVAIQSMLYVLPAAMPREMPAQIKTAVKNEGWDVNAVFIRGASNVYLHGSAWHDAGELLTDALQKLIEKYGVRIRWRFGEAKNLMSTRKVMTEYDPELAAMELSWS